MTPTDSSTNCPECDWPMVREAVPRTPDDSPGTAADVRGGPTSSHQRARCPNCGYVIEPESWDERL